MLQHYRRFLPVQSSEYIRAPPWGACHTAPWEPATATHRQGRAAPWGARRRDTRGIYGLCMVPVACPLAQVSLCHNDTSVSQLCQAFQASKDGDREDDAHLLEIGRRMHTY